MVVLLVILTIVVFVIVDFAVRTSLRKREEAKLRRERSEALDIGLKLDFTDEAHSLKRVEEEVEGLGFVRRAAAVGVDRGGTEGEQMWVFVEPNGDRAKETEAYDDMVIDVVSAVHGRLGMRPGRVYLVEPRSIPMTANGKLKHAALRGRRIRRGRE